MLMVLALVGTTTDASALATGPDVSNHQHPGGAPIDWNAVRDAGHSFAFVKATEAADFTNSWFARDWAAAGAAGLYRSAYHYAQPALPLSTAVAQARWFVSVTGTMTGPRDLPPVLDLEETNDLSPTDLAAWTRAWLTEVERLTGKPPMIYVGYFFWRDKVGAPADIANRYRLWLPQWTTASAPSLIPQGWRTWSFWQYTNAGTIPGISTLVDINRFCCDPATLASYTGAAAGAGNPFGAIDLSRRVPGGVGIVGWAIDPDTTQPIPVHLYVDGAFVATLDARATRTDIGAAYPGFGSEHGFAATLPVPAGARTVCAYAINVSAGNANPSLGCRALDGSPIGSIETISDPANGELVVSGWATDPDTSQPIEVRLFVDGRYVTSTAAGAPRPDVAATYPLGGANHGFAFSASGFSQGPHYVCVQALNVSTGDDTLLGCRFHTVREHDPVGNVDVVSTTLGRARVAGWALDVDATGASTVHVYVDGAFAASVRADRPRPDVAAAVGGAGPAHGFDVTVPVGGGQRTVCAYGLNVGPGTSRVLGCRSVSVPVAPVGALDLVQRSGEVVRAAGWGIDPDTTGPIDVHVYVDGALVAIRSAAAARADIGAAFPGYGAGHGFDVTVPVGGGPRTVCIYLIDSSGGGPNPSLGCRAV